MRKNWHLGTVLAAALFVAPSVANAATPTYDFLAGGGVVSNVQNLDGLFTETFSVSLPTVAAAYSLYVDWTAPTISNPNNVGFWVVDPNRTDGLTYGADTSIGHSITQASDTFSGKVFLTVFNSESAQFGAFNVATLTSGVKTGSTNAVPGPVAGAGLASIGFLIIGALIIRRREEQQAI